nr:MAG TPA: hypothetical protein [Caudoviricetes sp.]
MLIDFYSSMNRLSTDDYILNNWICTVQYQLVSALC